MCENEIERRGYRKRERMRTTEQEIEETKTEETLKITYMCQSWRERKEEREDQQKKVREDLFKIYRRK